MEKFIENFKNQLEDVNTELSPDFDYVNSDFWDSLTAVTIQMMVEDEYDLKVDIKTISSFKTISEFYQYILDNK
ncbi:acyl carrier protein [Flavobacterium sp. 245]|uniref:acyl carrier protein n=1 Tax=Flavobacterium sp. 245 TaxID=2512115 RepID=UPI00106003CC|nr:acyl carrier protein [Flavobacterium sp. 245]TDP00915.1 acyl carrier protein [Flavobacterium sp. 245]